jgi:hypothetical protein
MAVVSSDRALKPSEARIRLLELIKSRAAGGLSEFMNELDDQCRSVAATGDLERVVIQRERLGRLLRATADIDSRLAGVAAGHLEAMSHGLDRIRVLLLGRIDAQKRAGQRDGVRVRVFDYIRANGTVRPRELTTTLSLDPAQTSRALKELVADGLIERAEPPDSGDRRAHWYKAMGAGMVQTSVSAEQV